MKKTTIYRKPKGENLFEDELTIAALSAMGNPLEQQTALHEKSCRAVFLQNGKKLSFFNNFL